MRKRLFVVCCVSVFLAAGFSQASEWRPVTAEELALKQPKTDPNADAEALFREIRILNEQPSFNYPRDIRTEYIRLKIFTSRGKDKYGNVEIPYFQRTSIGGVEGRTIKPDGTIVELRSDAIFNKVVVRANGIKVKVVSFAMPAVEPEPSSNTAGMPISAMSFCVTFLWMYRATFPPTNLSFASSPQAARNGSRCPTCITCPSAEKSTRSIRKCPASRT